MLPTWDGMHFCFIIQLVPHRWSMSVEDALYVGLENAFKLNDSICGTCTIKPLKGKQIFLKKNIINLKGCDLKKSLFLFIDFVFVMFLFSEANETWKVTNICASKTDRVMLRIWSNSIPEFQVC